MLVTLLNMGVFTMQSPMLTKLAQLIASHADSMNYITYVFKCLEDDVDSKYIMCIRYRNWKHRDIKLGEIGFLTYEIITAGTSTWYDGERMIPYKYNAVQFLKFIEKPKSHEFVM